MNTMVKLTAEDYEILPETGPRYQLIEGDLYMSPAPNRLHQQISANLQYILTHWVRTHPGSGKIYDAPFDLFLDNENVFQPDLLFLRPEKFHLLTKKGCEGPPDVIVEILSPRTRQVDLVPKKKVYAAKGVTELWIVDPPARTVSVYELQKSAGEPREIVSETGALESVFFPGLVINGAEVFED